MKRKRTENKNKMENKNKNNLEKVAIISNPNNLGKFCKQFDIESIDMPQDILQSAKIEHSANYVALYNKFAASIRAPKARTLNDEEIVVLFTENIRTLQAGIIYIVENFAEAAKVLQNCGQNQIPSKIYFEYFNGTPLTIEFTSHRGEQK